jgi:hypothetical protein
MKIGQDPIYDVEQKGEIFWRKIFNCFHEHKHLGDHLFKSDRNKKITRKKMVIHPRAMNKV